jgi:hypothetical protein
MNYKILIVGSRHGMFVGNPHSSRKLGKNYIGECKNSARKVVSSDDIY